MFVDMADVVQGAILDSIDTRRSDILANFARRESQKGKARATQRDFDVEEEDLKALQDLDRRLQDLNKRCSDLIKYREEEANGLGEDGGGLVSHSVPLDDQGERFEGQRERAPRIWKHSIPVGSADEESDGDPILNPFTGQFAYKNTGFEPGPSESKTSTFSQVQEARHIAVGITSEPQKSSFLDVQKLIIDTVW